MLQIRKMNIPLPDKLLNDLTEQFSSAMEPYDFKQSEIKEVQRDYRAAEMKNTKGKKKAAVSGVKKKKEENKKKKMKKDEPAKEKEKN